MATCSFEAWAGRDLPTWRQPNAAATARNPSPPREFPLLLKWQGGFCAERRARSGLPGSVFGVHCGLLKVAHLIYFHVLCLRGVSGLVTKPGKLRSATSVMPGLLKMFF